MNKKIVNRKEKRNKKIVKMCNRGYTPIEVAEKLGISRQAVQTIYHRDWGRYTNWFERKILGHQEREGRRW